MSTQTNDPAVAMTKKMRNRTAALAVLCAVTAVTSIAVAWEVSRDYDLADNTAVAVSFVLGMLSVVSTFFGFKFFADARNAHKILGWLEPRGGDKK